MLCVQAIIRLRNNFLMHVIGWELLLLMKHLINGSGQKIRRIIICILIHAWKKDIDAMVLRDRNHPSVIFWSIGNEINERVDSSGLRIEKQLRDEVKFLDSTRPVTEAICFFWDHPGYKWDTTAACICFARCWWI